MTLAARTVLATGLAVAAVLTGAGPAFAQGGPSATITVNPADVLFPTPTGTDFEAGMVLHGGVTITVEPKNKNRPNWELFVQAGAADLGGYGKPVQDIEYQVQGSSTWVPLSTTAQLIATGSGSTTLTLTYRLLLDLTVDEPGTYTVPLEYTSNSF